MSENKFFKPDGSLHDGLVFGDPYRVLHSSTSDTVAGREFASDGYPSDDLMEAAVDVVEGGTAHPNSVAAQIYHATHFANNTKGNYTPVYYWR